MKIMFYRDTQTLVIRISRGTCTRGDIVIHITFALAPHISQHLELQTFPTSDISNFRHSQLQTFPTSDISNFRHYQLPTFPISDISNFRDFQLQTSFVPRRQPGSTVQIRSSSKLPAIPADLWVIQCISDEAVDVEP